METVFTVVLPASTAYANRQSLRMIGATLDCSSQPGWDEDCGSAVAALHLNSVGGDELSVGGSAEGTEKRLTLTDLLLRLCVYPDYPLNSMQ